LVLPNVTITKGQVGLGVAAATSVASSGGFDHGFPAAGSSARNVTGGRKLARHDSWAQYFWTDLRSKP
jgi:hypothetical protein